MPSTIELPGGRTMISLEIEDLAYLASLVSGEMVGGMLSPDIVSILKAISHISVDEERKGSEFDHVSNRLSPKTLAIRKAIVDDDISLFPSNLEGTDLIVSLQEISLKLSIPTRGDKNTYYERCDELDPSKNEKVAIVREIAKTEGLCFANLILSCSRVMSLSDAGFYIFVMRYVSRLGQWPSGKKACEALWDSFSDVFDDANQMQYRRQIAEVKEEVMKSPVRFLLNTDGEFCHLSVSTLKCDHDSHNCSHGWSAAQVLSTVSTADQKMGGVFGPGSTFDFDEFVDSNSVIRDDQETASISVAPNNASEHGFWVSNGERIREASQGAPLKDDCTPEPLARGRRFEEVGGQDGQVNRREWAEGLGDTRKEATTILPCDSASCAGQNQRGGKAQFDTGRKPESTTRMTRYSTSGERQLEVIHEQLVLPTMINGYMMNGHARLREHDHVRQNHRKINGLNGPFKNNRLNTLLHLNTGIELARPKGETYLSFFTKILRSQNRNPSVQFLKVCLRCTFDFEDLHIVANPMDLPYIAIGMDITEANLARCFDSLYDELKSLWFREMVSLKVPKFHTAYDHLSETVGGSSTSAGSRRLSDNGSSKKSTSKSRSNSVLSFRSSK